MCADTRKPPPFQFGLGSLLSATAVVAVVAWLVMEIPPRDRMTVYGLCMLALPFAATIAGAWVYERWGR